MNNNAKTYSFDLSYYMNKNHVTDDDIFAITNKYPSCKWYVSDIGPFGDESTKPKPVQRSNGFIITSVTEFKKLIAEVNNTPNIFFDFVHKNIDPDWEHSVRIYCSDSFYAEMSPAYKSKYDMQKLKGTDLKIYSLISKKNK
jgi:hypothetical protein